MSERRILWILGITSSTIVICEVVVIIWVFIDVCCQLFKLFIINMKGSVVVFTTYSSWTYSDPESEYYCHKTPMLFAFILLLIKWLLVPAIMVRSFFL